MPLTRPSGVPLHRLVLNGVCVHDVDDGLELEGEAGEGGAQEVDADEVVRLEDHVPPQSPTRITNLWMVRPSGVLHSRKTWRMRD